MSENTQRNIIRIIVPLVLLVGGGLIAWLALSGAPKTSTTTPAPAAVQSSSPAGQAASAPADKPVDKPVASSASNPPQPAQPTQPAEPAGQQGAALQAPTAPSPAPTQSSAASQTLRVRELPAATLLPLGGLDPKDKGGTYELQLAFSPIGAGVETITLANHFTTIQKTTHEVIQEFQIVPGQNRLGLVAFAADAIEVNQQRLSLWATPDAGKTFWREVSPGVFEAIVEDDAGNPVLKLTREFQLKPGSYEFTLKQSIANLSDKKLAVRYLQFGPKELPLPQTRYGGDVRRARFGYTLPLSFDPAQIVQSGDSRATLITHSDLLGSPTGVDPRSGLSTWSTKVVWPTAETTKRELSLVWAATTSRYFTIAVHNPVGSPSKTLRVAESIERVSIPTPASINSRGPQGISVLRLLSPTTDIAPASSVDMSVTAYAGPLSKTYTRAEKGAFWAGLERVVIFTFGGPCGFCTFQPVAEFLRWFLGLLHDYVFHDWALAIMFLVVCVRSLLHPVTRWSQTNMLRFGKHMSRLAPKQKAIQEKYANDPTKMREEIARLMREEHISYSSGAMGCVPMFLQMPVWIALYAMLFFTFELRHEHAFYGLIQSATNHTWGFMGDLAEPDHFLSFGTSFSIPLLSSIMGPIEAFNILPLVMGVVFFIQQKYMQPPQTTTLSPEMEQQQKIMKVMTVVMFPLFMYNAPSGLALYFLTNSTLGILESKWVRARAEKLIEEEDRQREAKKLARKASGAPEPEGFFARMQKLVEERQKMIEQKQKASKRKG